MNPASGGEENINPAAEADGADWGKGGVVANKSDEVDGGSLFNDFEEGVQNVLNRIEEYREMHSEEGKKLLTQNGELKDQLLASKEQYGQSQLRIKELESENRALEHAKEQATKGEKEAETVWEKAWWKLQERRKIEPEYKNIPQYDPVDPFLASHSLDSDYMRYFWLAEA